MLLRLLIVSLFCLSPLAGVATAVQPQDRPERGDRPRRPAAPSEQEWRDAVRFMEAHSPNRLRIVRRMEARIGEGANPRALARSRARVWSRVGRLLRKKSDEAGDYPILLDLYEKEDAVLGAVMALRRTERSGTDEATATARQVAVEAATEYVRAGLKVRRENLRRQREKLQRELSAIEQDEKNVQAEADEMIERFSRLLPPVVEQD